MLKTSKIISIEESETTECYDISVPKYENFFLGNGILSHNCFASQDIVSIPRRLAKQCSKIMVPYNVNFEVAKDAMKLAGLAEAEVQANQYNKIRRTFERMEKFDWMFIDVNTKSYDIIRPLAPLSWALETGE